MRRSPKAIQIEKYMALGLSADEAEKAFQHEKKWQEFYAYFVKELSPNKENLEDVRKVFADNKHNPLFQDFLKARLNGENTDIAGRFEVINKVADEIVIKANEGIKKALEEAMGDDIEM